MNVYAVQLHKGWLDLWGKLPAEVKVAVYLALSYGLSELIVELGEAEVNSTYLAIALNILIVFLKNLKPRLKARK